MNELLNYVNTLLNDVVNDMSGDYSSFLFSAKIIAGIGALIAVFLTWNESVTKAEGINMNEIWRISALALGIMFYGSFLNLINMPLNLISNNTKVFVSKQTKSTDNFFESYDFNKHQKPVFVTDSKKEEKINEILNNSGGGNPSDSQKSNKDTNKDNGWGGFVMDVFTGGSLRDKAQMYLIEGLFNFLHFLGVIAIIVLNVIRSFLLIVLSFFGIFVLAFSVYPPLKGSFVKWLEKYINVFLWLPISYILQGFISKLFTYFRSAHVSFGSTQTDLINSTNNTVLALVGICSLVAFATVPTISSWLISAATNAAGSKIKNKATQGAQKAAQVAVSAKTGGAGAIVSKK